MRFLTISLTSSEVYKITQTSLEIKVLITKLVQLEKTTLKSTLRRKMKLLFHKYPIYMYISCISKRIKIINFFLKNSTYILSLKKFIFNKLDNTNK